VGRSEVAHSMNSPSTTVGGWSSTFLMARLTYAAGSPESSAALPKRMNNSSASGSSLAKSGMSDVSLEKSTAYLFVNRVWNSVISSLSFSLMRRFAAGGIAAGAVPESGAALTCFSMRVSVVRWSPTGLGAIGRAMGSERNIVASVFRCNRGRIEDGRRLGFLGARVGAEVNLPDGSPLADTFLTLHLEPHLALVGDVEK